MALITESYTADGTTRIYTIATTLLSQSHCRVDLHYDDIDHEIAPNLWNVINNSIVFNEAPLLGYTVKITVSTTGAGLEAAPSVYSDVASNINAILTTASIEQDVKDVAAMGPQITYIASGGLLVPNNLSDVADVVESRANLGVESRIHTINTTGSYVDATDNTNFKLYIDNGNIVLEEI